MGVVAFLLWSTNRASWAGWGRGLGSRVEGPRSPGQRLQSATKATLHLPHLLNFPILHNSRLRGHLSLRDEALALCLQEQLCLPYPLLELVHAAHVGPAFLLQLQLQLLLLLLLLHHVRTHLICESSNLCGVVAGGGKEQPIGWMLSQIPRAI